MAQVNVKLVEGVFSPEQQQIVRDLTATMVAIEGENTRPVTGSSSRRSGAATGASPATR